MSIRIGRQQVKTIRAAIYFSSENAIRPSRNTATQSPRAKARDTANTNSRSRSMSCKFSNEKRGEMGVYSLPLGCRAKGTATFAELDYTLCHDNEPVQFAQEFLYRSTSRGCKSRA